MRDAKQKGRVFRAGPVLSSRWPRALLVAGALAVAACGGDAPFLWEVQGQQGSIVHLFGTYHFDGSARDTLPDSAWAAFAQASLFVAEADIRDTDALTLWEQARLPAGQGLNQLLSPDAWQQLVQVLAPAPPGQLATVRPWLINVLLLAKLQPNDEAIDVALMREAGRSGKQLQFLETTAQQVELLNQIPLYEGVAQLERDMNDFARLERDLDALLAAYRRGDAEAFLARDGYDRQSETFDIIIRQRNRSWLPQVEALLAGSAPAFVAVGVSHLIGPDSVVELLRDGGHEVWRLAQ
jgi:uncharacterized protein YbaP (TraB family)